MNLLVPVAIFGVTLATGGWLVGIASAGEPGAPIGERVEYRIPAGNPAPRRVGGSTRGVAPQLPGVVALVPDHLGLTAMAQPSLFWYLSAPSRTRIEFVLIEPGRVVPLLEVTTSGAAQGIQQLDLRKHGVTLRPGIEYEWSVAVVVDADQRSTDIVSGGAIMRVDEGSLAARAGAQDPAAIATAYAAQGLWYDTLLALAQAMEQSPAQRGPRARRSSLLEQAGLAEVAAFERRQ